MKKYNVNVSIMAECESDLIERIEDIDCPIDEYDGNSIKEVEDD